MSSIRFRRGIRPGLLLAVLWWWLPAASAAPDDSARRLEVLFLGSENISGHDPLARFRVIRQALGRHGVNFTWSATLDALTPGNLSRYDVLLIFANHYAIDRETQGRALLDFVREGGGCVLIHCAAGCFRDSAFDGYVDLLGAQFDDHGWGVVRPRIVDPDHPVMRGYEGFECEDETYVHKRHGAGRTILQERDGEPWTWVKPYGRGRVFYTASGHDHRCWSQPAFHDLIHRAVRWTAGRAADAVDRLAPPQLAYRPAAVPENPANPVGPNNELQLPLTPEESLKLAQVPPGFVLRLFAAEPAIVNPIALNWDERGRLWVVEALNYPHDIDPPLPADRIRILEDTDGDGQADRSAVFADRLELCTSVLPVEGGAIATSGRDMVFLRDDDGDGRADRREVIFTGISLDDTHACVSNLRYGFDNWIYATVGYSGIDTVVAGTRHAFQMAVFRFRADGSALEVLQHTSNNTWGLAFTSDGDVAGSTANDNPSWYLNIPVRAWVAAGRPPAKVPAADRGEFLYPVTTDYFQNWPKEKCSSGSGHAICHSSLFPEDWREHRAFICEAPMHLVAAPAFRNEGTEFHTTGFEHNLYASADAWSSPVVAETGPDGAVWIADWYAPVFNHNVYRPAHQERGPGNAYVTPDRDRERGRIYRILPAGAAPRQPPPLRTPAECVAALCDPDLFWRLTAQRLLVQRPGGGAVRDALLALAREDAGPPSLHALRALQGIAPDDPALTEAAQMLTRSAHRGTAAAAIDLIPRDDTGRNLFLDLLRDESLHPMVRKHAAIATVELPRDSVAGGELLEILRADSVTGHLATAVRLACLRHPEGFFRALVEGDRDPAPDIVERAFAEGLEILTADKSWLSSGLLAAARSATSRTARRITEAAGAVPAAAEAVSLSGSAQRGREVYLYCVACHQPQGEGIPGAFPALAGSVRAVDDRAVKIVLHGLMGPLESRGRQFNGIMPGHGEALTDRQVADVLNYIRNSWGNRAGDISEGRIAEIRAETAGRIAPWTQEELDP